MKMVYKSFPVRRISPADGHYFFGYYDLQPISGNLHLAHKVDFIDRLQRRDETVEIGLIEMGKEKFERLDTTAAWCFQQGAMLQWNPAAPNDEIIYNCTDGLNFYATIMNIHTGAKRYLDRPVANVSPKGDYALSINFERMYNFRPGYGYAGIGDPFFYDNHSDKDGIYLIDMNTGKSRLIISMQQIWDFYGKAGFKGVDKKIVVNHITFNTDGTRFLFIVRDFHGPGERHTNTLITANRDGSDMYLLSDIGCQSHYHWRDPEHVLFFTDGKELDYRRGFLNNYVLKDKTHEGELMSDGFFRTDQHMSYSPDRRFLLTDSYPDKNNAQALRITDLERQLTVETGKYITIIDYCKCEAWCCDLHPAWSPDGKLVSIDSTHEGQRGIYVLDVDEVREYMDSLDMDNLPYNVKTIPV